MRLIRRVWRAATTRERAVLLACLAYLAWPLDVIPEGLFGLVGLTDDLAALGVLWTLVRRIRLRLP
jgi:uncharacterized membrane protein YkvA (DUF1232 family)